MVTCARASADAGCESQNCPIHELPVQKFKLKPDQNFFWSRLNENTGLCPVTNKFGSGLFAVGTSSDPTTSYTLQN